MLASRQQSWLKIKIKYFVLPTEQRNVSNGFCTICFVDIVGVFTHKQINYNTTYIHFCYDCRNAETHTAHSAKTHKNFFLFTLTSGWGKFQPPVFTPEKLDMFDPIYCFQQVFWLNIRTSMKRYKQFLHFL